ncbi:MAG: ABC transporter ATP-binding protein [Chthoniobacterales bacterium]
MSLLSLEAVSKIYHVGDQEIHALNKIDLNINEGDFASIIGPSGSGKSTLMHLIGCLDTPSEGRMEICGHDISSASSNQLAAVRNQTIGFVFQSFNLLPKLSVVENIELPLIYSGLGARKRRERAEFLAETVGLAERLKNRPSQLSGGQCQRVAIARALANEPKIILGDEPTGNLDSATGEIILELFHKLHKQGRTIILVTHDPDIAQVSKRIIEIKDGKVLRDHMVEDS